MQEKEREEIVRYWADYYARSAFRNKIGIKLDSLSEEGAVLHIDVDPEFHWQTANIVHGGVIATLIDSAISTAARWFMQKGQRTVTTDLNIHYLRPAVGEKLTAKAKISHAGKSLMFGTCEVYAGDKKVAFGSASYRVLDMV